MYHGQVGTADASGKSLAGDFEITLAANSARGSSRQLPRALALIIAAPFSAIMIVGALVLVELTAGARTFRHI